MRIASVFQERTKVSYHTFFRFTAANHTSRSGEGDSLSEDIEQLFELTRIVVMVLTTHLPTLAEPSAKGVYSN